MTNTISYEFNMYPDTPTLKITLNKGESIAYLSPFRGYRFQVSETKSGNNYISASMTNTKMYELTTISCGHAILFKLALDALSRAKADPVRRKTLDEFIDVTIEWLKKYADDIDWHNSEFQAGDIMYIHQVEEDDDYFEN